VAGARLPQGAVAVAHVDVVDVARDLDAGALAEVRERAGLPGDDAAAVVAGGAGVAGLGLDESGGGRGGEGGEGREGEDGRQTHGGEVLVVLCCWLLLSS
jgi:hypothetical protein